MLVTSCIDRGGAHLLDVDVSVFNLIELCDNVKSYWGPSCSILQAECMYQTICCQDGLQRGSEAVDGVAQGLLGDTCTFIVRLTFISMSPCRSRS